METVQSTPTEHFAAAAARTPQITVTAEPPDCGQDPQRVYPSAHRFAVARYHFLFIKSTSVLVTIWKVCTEFALLPLLPHNKQMCSYDRLLTVGKLRHKDVRQLAQGHAGYNWMGCDFQFPDFSRCGGECKYTLESFQA